MPKINNQMSGESAKSEVNDRKTSVTKTPKNVHTRGFRQGPKPAKKK